MTSVFQGLSLSRSRGREGEDPGNEVAALDKYSLQCPHNSLVCFHKQEDIFTAQREAVTLNWKQTCHDWM